MPAGGRDDFPVVEVNDAEAGGFCRRLMGAVRAAGDLPARGWNVRLPTETQWEYACRAGTTTTTEFGDRLGRRPANFRGGPYNRADGGDGGTPLGRAAPSAATRPTPGGCTTRTGT